MEDKTRDDKIVEIAALGYDIRKIVSALNTLKQASNQLVEAWFEVQSKDADTMLSYGYPFDNDFREVNSDINNWVKESNKKLYPIYTHFLLRMPVKMVELLELAEIIGEYQMNTENILVSFEFNGTRIANPFVDETSILPVDPIIYYGRTFLESDFCHEIRMKQALEKWGIERDENI